jgi:hypothetical protein
VKLSVDWLLSVQDEHGLLVVLFIFTSLFYTGNWPPSADEIGRTRGDKELLHWCHGAPGVVYLMAAAYLCYDKQDKYLKVCVLFNSYFIYIIELSTRGGTNMDTRTTTQGTWYMSRCCWKWLCISTVVSFDT